MRLQDIGFYTLNDERAKNSSRYSPLWRCELILTDKCNFKCPYCMPLCGDAGGILSFDASMNILKLWVTEGLRNVRFSGGEPTLYKGIEKLVTYCKDNKVEHIAMSTNGSAKFEKYQELMKCGINDFSISLDAHYKELGDKMAGKKGAWNRVVQNIRDLSKECYVTLGVVFNEENIHDAVDIIKFADELGAADIRIISSAQYNQAIEQLDKLPQELLARHPILKYRVERYKNNQPIRGLSEKNCSKCKLVLDDMAIAGNSHYPCIIYMRQNGKPIGKVSETMRDDRLRWYKTHNTFEDPICKRNCLDVCVNFNDRCRNLGAD